MTTYIEHRQTPLLENKPKPAYRDITFGIKLMRLYLKLLNKLSRSRATNKVVELFLTPQSKSKKEKYSQWYGKLQDETFKILDNEISTWRSDDHPTILLVHGWSSTSYRFDQLVDRLIANGFDILLIDLPAHGRSSGRITNLKEVENTIIELVNQFPKINTIIGHSFGGTASLQSITTNKIEKFISIAAPLHYQYITIPFFELLQVPNEIIPRFYDRIETIVGRPKEKFSEVSLLTEDIEILLIHDEDDTIVPIDYTQHLAHSREYINLMQTKELGHRKILGSTAVLDNIIRFLRR